jgi:hypothetical protein
MDVLRCIFDYRRWPGWLHLIFVPALIGSLADQIDHHRWFWAVCGAVAFWNSLRLSSRWLFLRG